MGWSKVLHKTSYFCSCFHFATNEQSGTIAWSNRTALFVQRGNTNELTHIQEKHQPTNLLPNLH